MIVRENLDHLICRPDDSLRTVIEKITVLGDPFTFQIVVDGEGRPVGTVTDGDIRRAFLQGANTDSEIAGYMHSNSATAPAGAPERAFREMAASLGVGFLPLVDGAGRLSSVYVLKGDAFDPRIALVMAGGRGQRLGGQTATTPKPLLDIRGKPMLGHILGRLEDAGIERIFISVHYLGEQIETFISRRKSRAKIEVLWEEVPLGTAGAVGLLGPVATPVMVLNGDVLTSVDYRAMGTFHNRHAHDTTIAVARHVVHIPFGVVQHDDEGLFQGIEEKPSFTHFVSAGIYQLSPETCALVASGEALDMPELLNRARSAGLTVGLFPIHEQWMDVGQSQDLEAAQGVEWTQTNSRRKEQA